MKSVMIENKKIKLLILFIIFLFILPAAVNAESQKVIFNHLDGIGDDYGSGDYHYPRNHIFQNKGNLFDLKSLTIFETENNYKFRLSFSNLTDPWGAKYNFSLPLIEIYIDNQSGGSNQLFHSGANVSFSDDFYWNNFFKISGWWVRAFTPDSKKEDVFNINELSLAAPNSMDNLILNKEANDIYLSFPKKEISSLKDSKMIVLVGSFDPFGYDHFRSLSKSRDYWQIYSENDVPISKAPRVLDILVPGGRNQKEILSGEIPELPFIKVASEIPAEEKTLVDYLMPINKFSITILLAYILLLIFVVYKFNYKR